MKTRFRVMIAAMMLCSMYASCSKDEPKMISPVETEFTSGQLAKLIEVVNEPCELKMVVRDGGIPSQIFQLKVKLKLKKESPELQSLDAQDIDFTGLLSVANIVLEDESGTKVQDLSVKSEDLLKLKKLLQANEGNEETIVFEETFYNSEDAPKWFDLSVQFRPYLSADIDVEKGKEVVVYEEVEALLEDEEFQDVAGDVAGGVEILLPSVLQGSVAVVPDNYKVVKGKYGYPEISITFKLLNEVNTSALVGSTNQMWIVGVGQDSEGRAVRELLPSYEEWRTNDSDGSEFKQFLEDTPGSTITMTFTGGDEGDVSEGINKVAKFKLKITN